jgi:SAM-dependent methyltransferase
LLHCHARKLSDVDSYSAPLIVDHRIYSQLYEMEAQHWWFRGRRAVIWALLGHAGVLDAPNGGAPLQILDAGCGTGRNLQEFGTLGEAIGVDASPTAVAFCHQHGLSGVRQARLEELPFEDDRFALTLAFDVVEHIENDGAALRELCRVTAPGGRLVLTVPMYKRLWSHHDDAHHHVRRYRPRDLRLRLTESGWRERFVTHFNTVLLPAIALVRASQRGRQQMERTDYELTPRWLNGALEVPLRVEAAAIRRGARLPAGVSLGVVCERP